MTNNSVNGNVTVTGNGENTLNIKNGIEGKDVLCAKSEIETKSAIVTIKNFKDITINSENAGDGLHADSKGGIVISDVDTINIGSADNRFEASGQAIHGLHGQVKLDVGTLNIYTDGQGIMAQNQVAEHGVDIQADNDVNIDTKGNAVMAAAMNSEKGTASVKITAGGQVNIQSEWYGVQLFDQDGTHPEWEGTNEINMVIKGYEGVNITSDTRYAVYMTRKNNSKASFEISSANGDVNLSGAGGLFIKPLSNATSDAIKNMNLSGTIQGQNVTVTSTQGATITMQDSSLKLSVNQDGGAITLNNTADAGTAVRVTGSKGSLKFGDGKTNTDVYVNGYMQVTDKANVTFAENTTTHVDSKYLTNKKQAFITTGGGENKGSVTLDGKLDIGNVATGTELNFSYDKELNKRAEGSIITNNVLQDIKVDKDGKMSVGTVTSDAAHKALAGSLLTDVALYATEKNVDGVTALLTGENDVEALNSAAGLSAMAGVEHGTYTAAGIFNDAVAGHLMNRNDEDVWAYGFHNKENVNGLSFGADYDAQYNGAVAGVDLYRNGGTVAGIALSYADGNVSGSNGFASTQNDAVYYGASLYARFDRGSYALLGDISYMKGDHDVTQWNKGQQITASPDSDAVSVGVKAVKDFTAGESGTLTPYIGVRYLRLSTDGFTAYNASYSGDDQDLVLIPVGVNYSAAITGGSWTFRPYAGVGYIWNAGDKSADQTVTLGTAANSFSYDTVDSGSFLTRVGFAADHGDMSCGVGYSWQKGDSVSNSAWTLSASFRF